MSRWDAFSTKARAVAASVPFVPDAVALWFAMRDPATPRWVKATIASALVYFVSTIDSIPDLLPLVGYTDDATVIGAALAVARGHITEAHRERARTWLAGSSTSRLPGS
jgi:uncharacterized membrane protein YkvA (DUF1232 family)